MKKTALMIALVVCASGIVSAQKSAIGLRGVDGGHGAEISYQTAIGKSNRLELDLGFNTYRDNYSGIQLTGIYQWVWGLEKIAPGFDWYAGLGGTVGSANSILGLALVGQVGIEYNFTIPLQISLDWRPTLFNTYYNNFAGNGFSIRYRF